MENATIQEKLKQAKIFMAKYAESIEKNKGSTVMAGVLSEFPEHRKTFLRQSTNIPSIDRFFGGGIPIGGPMTIAGPESSGKTSFALRVVAAYLQSGKVSLYCDAENSLTEDWVRTQGIDPAMLPVIASGLAPSEEFTPAALEDYLNFTIKAISTGLYNLVVIDSLDAMISRGRLKAKKGKERDLDDADIALKARVLSDFYPRIVGDCRAKGITIIQIGQLRTFGIGSAFTHNDISGGNARKYFDLMTLHIRRGEKKGWPEGGYTFVMEAKKSKISGVLEGASMETAFFFGKGFDPVYEETVEALHRGIIARKGNAAAEYTDLNGNLHKIGFGKEARIAAYIEENGLVADLHTQLTGEIIEEETEEKA